MQKCLVTKVIYSRAALPQYQ